MANTADYSPKLLVRCGKRFASSDLRHKNTSANFAMWWTTSFAARPCSHDSNSLSLQHAHETDERQPDECGGVIAFEAFA